MEMSRFIQCHTLFWYNFNLGSETIDILLEVLVDFIEDGKTILHEAAEKGISIPFKKVIWKNKIEPSITKQFNLCVNLGRVKFVELIAKGGGNINIEDKFGNTPMHYAVTNGIMYLWSLWLNRKLVQYMTIDL